MASKKMKVITVSINSEEVKICEVVGNNKNVQVLQAVAIPTPELTYDDGELIDIEKFSKILKQTIYEKEMKAKNITFTLSGSRIANKEIVVPFVKKDKIKPMVDANSSEYFPVNVDEYVFTHSVLESFKEEDKKKLRLMVIAAPEAMVESYYMLADRLELNLVSMDYYGNSTLQMIKQQIDEKPNIVIQVNNNNTIVSILEAGVLKLQRTIPYGRNVVIHALAEKNEISEEEAAKLLESDTEYVHGSFDGDTVTESLKYMLGNLSRIVDYYVTRNQGAPLDKAYLIEKGGPIKGLNKLLNSELNHSVTVIDTLKNVTIAPECTVDTHNILSYMENIGAVLEPVSFIPKKQLDIAKRRGTSNDLRALIIGSAFISVVLIGYPFINYNKALKEKEVLEYRIEKIQDVQQVVDDYYTAKDKAADMLNYVTMTVNNNDTLLEMLNKMEEVIPSDVEISSLNVTDGIMTFTATASSKLCVAKLIEELEAMSNVYDVKITGVSENIDDNGVTTESFSITLGYIPIIDIEELLEETTKEAE